MTKHADLSYSTGCQMQLYPLPAMPFWTLEVLPISLKAAYGSWEQSCPYYPPNSESLVWPNGMIPLSAFPEHVILMSFFEYSISTMYPIFANRSIQSGRKRDLMWILMFLTSYRIKVIQMTIKEIGKSGMKVSKWLKIHNKFLGNAPKR